MLCPNFRKDSNKDSLFLFANNLDLKKYHLWPVAQAYSRQTFDFIFRAELRASNVKVPDSLQREVFRIYNRKVWDNQQHFTVFKMLP